MVDATTLAERRAAGHPAPGACYVYCVVPAPAPGSLGPIGIEGAEVYGAEAGDLGVVVHDCAPVPYQTQDLEVAGPWLLAHHRVIEVAWRLRGVALPFTFNTIVAAGDGPAHDRLRAWLVREREPLLAKLRALEGKGEYIVQIFCDVRVVSRQLLAVSAPLRALEEAVQTSSPGTAYLQRQALASALKRALEQRARADAQAFLDLVRGVVDDLRIERVKQAQGEMTMLLNLSCLVRDEEREAFAAALDSVAQREGYSVRRVGPLPPYSFSA